MDGCRFWDLAATAPKDGSDPDYTAGVLMGRKDGIFYICDVVRFRGTPAEVEKKVRQTAIVDRDRPEFRDIEIRMEEEPGSSGIGLTSHYSRNVLRGFNFRSYKTTGSKEVRANPASASAEMGNMAIVNSNWLINYLDELEAFPHGAHDDQVDATSGAFAVLSEIPDAPIQVAFAKRPS
jgi:predicted phage terminase large subunit-like protein